MNCEYWTKAEDSIVNSMHCDYTGGSMFCGIEQHDICVRLNKCVKSIEGGFDKCYKVDKCHKVIVEIKTIK